MLEFADFCEYTEKICSLNKFAASDVFPALSIPGAVLLNN
jgi:hypothetical protein